MQRLDTKTFKTENWGAFLPDSENSVGLFEGFQVLPACPSHKIGIKMKKSRTRWCSDTDREGLKCLEETQQRCSFFQHKFRMWIEPSWNVMAHGDAREGKWRGNRRMQWVASTLHTTSEHGVSSTTTADAHTSGVSIQLNWRPRRFKWTRPFRRKTKSGFCACAITFQTQSSWFTLHIKHSTCHLQRTAGKCSFSEIIGVYIQFFFKIIPPA